MSQDWALNDDKSDEPQRQEGDSTSLTIFRPDTSWRRSWRERHSLNFFVNFSAPQMSGFFDSAFWHRMVIQTSYYEPAILHAITAIGALHECIMQRAYGDEHRRATAMAFALSQCNKAIAELTNSQTRSSGIDLVGRSQKAPNSRLALTTCILFTAFEAMQGRCDSAVNHALQGRRLLQATDRPYAASMSKTEEEDLEHMRPIIERLEVQATALLDKGRRPEAEPVSHWPPLLPLDRVYSLDHAHSTLHSAMNSAMRFMQGFHPTAPRDHITVNMTEKYMIYVPWFAQWEAAFTTYLAENRDVMTTVDLKRAMVLKANHLVGTMLASVDQSAGPVAYDAYEAEFRAIVDLSREVLATYSCPPLPTLVTGGAGVPYLSFSLWVTDPLWMAISRCRNTSIRQAAFTLLSQNPRQEGIWHAGPMFPNNKQPRNEARSDAMKRKSELQKSQSVPLVKRKRTPEAAGPSQTMASSRTVSVVSPESPANTSSNTSASYATGEVRTIHQAGDLRVKAEWYAGPSQVPALSQ